MDKQNAKIVLQVLTVSEMIWSQYYVLQVLIKINHFKTNVLNVERANIMINQDKLHVLHVRLEVIVCGVIYYLFYVLLVHFRIKQVKQNAFNVQMVSLIMKKENRHVKIVLLVICAFGKLIYQLLVQKDNIKIK